MRFEYGCGQCDSVVWVCWDCNRQIQGIHCRISPPPPSPPFPTSCPLGSPNPQDDDPCLLQVWLQEFCWSFRSKQAKLGARNQSAPDNAELHAAPMFCFEVHSLILDPGVVMYWLGFAQLRGA